MGFRGAEEHALLKCKESFKIFGLLIEADGPTYLGDEVYQGDNKVGVITCHSYSKLTYLSMAIARLDVDVAKQGKPLEVRGANVKAKAVAHTISFDDPEKKKRTAVG